MLLITALSILICLIFVPCAAGTDSIRAMYEFPFVNAYSAAVDMPAYQILDLGRDITPFDVSDSAVVLYQGVSKELVRWRAGMRETLDSSNPQYWSSMNNAHSVVQIVKTSAGQELFFWEGLEKEKRQIDLNEGLLEYPGFLQPFAFSDNNHLFIRRDSETILQPMVEYTARIEVDKLDAVSGDWETLALHDSVIKTDFTLAVEGQILEISDVNTQGEYVGSIYEEKFSSGDNSTGQVYEYQNQYYTLDGSTVLDFEPLGITNNRSIIGRTAGPIFNLIILDEFGERVIAPDIQELGMHDPLMSNPDNGLEEIVLGGNFWKRMTERDFTGMPLGSPSPDFWQGTLEDLLINRGQWRKLEATAISPNGRIAGIGQLPDPSTGEMVSHGFLLLPPLLIPDWDRDGVIGKQDRKFSSERLTWRLWINNDDDSGDIATSYADDLPGSSDPDWETPQVDGIRDLVDYFPLLIDLQDLLKTLDSPEKVKLVLRQADGALNAVLTTLSPEQVGLIHTHELPEGFVSSFPGALGNAPTINIDRDGISLSSAFIEGIRLGNLGVILLEGCKYSQEPLVMEFHYEGKEVFSSNLPLSVSPVRDMLNVVNLRNCDPKFNSASTGPWPTKTDDPPNLPEAYLKTFAYPLRTMIHIHGFNWGGEEIPAAHSELFKRFYQSGSHARFIGVSWFGDQGTLNLTGSSFDYNENVINAFITAGYLKTALTQFTGPFTYLFAHSLGNMVASSAIVDHSLDIDSYFMVNAAVPLEAYLGEQEDRRLMVHPEWKNEGDTVPDYPERLLAANWSKIFPEDDRRGLIAWRDRFKTITERILCYNFYSSGENILRKGNGDMPNLFSEVWNRELIWVYNEMNKGSGDLSSTLTNDVQGGWGFNYHYMDWYDPGGAAHPPAGSWIPMSTVDADRLTNHELIAEPFFRRFSSGDSDFLSWGNGAWLYGEKDAANQHLPTVPFRNSPSDALQNHAKILAEAIPAYSAPTGSSPLSDLFLLMNFDLDRQFRNDRFWPARDNQEKADRWLHSDYLTPALPYVSGFYYTCTQLINEKR